MSFKFQNVGRPVNLVTLAEAKRHVSVDHDLDDALLETMRLSASDLVIDYLKIDVDDTSFDWVDAFGEPDVARGAIPGRIKAATLMSIGAFYENRDGDEWRSPQVLPAAVVAMLARSRDPAMA